MSTSFKCADIASPEIALNDSLINSTRIGIIKGKLSIAIKVARLFALEAIALVKVRVNENPIQPKPRLRIKKGMFMISMVASNDIAPKHMSPKTKSSRML